MQLQLGNMSLINVQCTLKPDGNWLLTSRDLPGFLLCGKHLPTLQADAPVVAEKLAQLNGRSD